MHLRYSSAPLVLYSTAPHNQYTPALLFTVNLQSSLAFESRFCQPLHDDELKKKLYILYKLDRGSEETTGFRNPKALSCSFPSEAKVLLGA